MWPSATPPVTLAVATFDLGGQQNSSYFRRNTLGAPRGTSLDVLSEDVLSASVSTGRARGDGRPHVHLKLPLLGLVNEDGFSSCLQRPASPAGVPQQRTAVQDWSRWPSGERSAAPARTRRTRSVFSSATSGSSGSTRPGPSFLWSRSRPGRAGPGLAGHLEQARVIPVCRCGGANKKELAS